MGQVGKLLLSVLKAINQVLIMFAHQSLKKFLFAFIITVKGSQCLAQRFDDIPQGSVLVAFLQKLRFCRLMDLIQSCQILIYGTRLLKKYSGAIYHYYIIVALKLNVKCFCIFYG